MSILWSSWWWQRLRVRQKLWGVLLLVFIPLVASIVAQITLINHIRTLQQQHSEIILAREQIEILRRTPAEAEKMMPVGIDGTDPAERGAWVALASVLLNLDEFITRE